MGNKKTGSCHVLRIKLVALALNFHSHFHWTLILRVSTIQFSFLIVVRIASALWHLRSALVTFALSHMKKLCGKAHLAAVKMYSSVRPDLSLLVELLTLNCFVSYVEALGVGLIRIPERVLTGSVSRADKNITTDRCNLSFSFLFMHAFPHYSFSFEHGTGTGKLYV